MEGFLDRRMPHNKRVRFHKKPSVVRFFNIILFLTPTIIAITVFSIILSYYSFPHTFVGNIDVSLKTREQIRGIINMELQKPIKLHIKDRTYAYLPSQIGFDVNNKVLINEIFKNNNGLFVNIFPFIKSLATSRKVTPFVTVSDLYDGWFGKTIFDFSQKQDSLTFDNSKKEVEFISNTEKYRIQTQKLKEEIYQQMENFQTNIITPSLIKIQENTLADTAKILNETYQKIINNPVTIVIDQTNPVKITLNSDDLKQILDVSLVNESIKLSANKEILKSIVLRKFSGFPQYNEKALDMDKIYNNMFTLTNLRLKGYQTDTIQTSTKYKPNTNGDKAAKYIEIDLSQQQMFLWENGSLIAQHLVSTGLYYPTPPGEYKILNKALNAYSYIYHVYMPYWMAFYMAPDIHAFLGIHELPYWISGSSLIRRPRDFLGSPHTGGCVSLDVGVAEKVFAWADIGTPVWIFK